MVIFSRPECKLLNGTVLLWILENGDVSCFNMRTVLTLTVIKWILLNWCVVHSNLGLAHVWLISPAFSWGICTSYHSSFQGTEPPISCHVWEVWDQTSVSSSSHCQSFLMWRGQIVPISWDPTWTFPLPAVKVHLKGGGGKPECESEGCKLVDREEWTFQFISFFCLTALHPILYHHRETSRPCALRMTASGHPWKWSEQAFTRQCTLAAIQGEEGIFYIPELCDSSQMSCLDTFR